MDYDLQLIDLYDLMKPAKVNHWIVLVLSRVHRHSPEHSPIRNEPFTLLYVPHDLEARSERCRVLSQRQGRHGYHLPAGRPTLQGHGCHLRLLSCCLKA
jgi:hypothetical protein